MQIVLQSSAALILGGAGLGHVIRQRATIAAIASHGIVGKRWAPVLARSIAITELAVAGLLFAGTGSAVALGYSSALVAYSAYVLRISPDPVACGCAGGSELLSVWTVTRGLLLVSMVLMARLGGKSAMASGSNTVSMGEGLQALLAIPALAVAVWVIGVAPANRFVVSDVS